MKPYLMLLTVLVVLNSAGSLVAFLRVQSVQGQQRGSIKTLHRQGREAVETHKGVCAFRDNLKTQARSGEKYLRQHPSGAPSLHISAAQIEQTIAREKKTIHALRDLNCPKT